MKSDRLTDTSVQLSERTKEILVQADYSESYKNADQNKIQSALCPYLLQLLPQICSRKIK